MLNPSSPVVNSLVKNTSNGDLVAVISGAALHKLRHHKLCCSVIYFGEENYDPSKVGEIYMRFPVCCLPTLKASHSSLQRIPPAGNLRCAC